MPSLDGEWVSFGYAVTRHLDLVNARYSLESQEGMTKNFSPTKSESVRSIP
jgi:hypothetical protein